MFARSLRIKIRRLLDCLELSYLVYFYSIRRVIQPDPDLMDSLLNFSTDEDEEEEESEAASSGPEDDRQLTSPSLASPSPPTVNSPPWHTKREFNLFRTGLLSFVCYNQPFPLFLHILCPSHLQHGPDSGSVLFITCLQPNNAETTSISKAVQVLR